VVADDNCEKALVSGGDGAMVQKHLSPNRSQSLLCVRSGQYQTSGTSDDDYTDGDERESDDETNEMSDDEMGQDASSSSIGSVVLTGAARWSRGSCGYPRKPRHVFRTR